MSDNFELKTRVIQREVRSMDLLGRILFNRGGKIEINYENEIADLNYISLSIQYIFSYFPLQSAVFFKYDNCTFIYRYIY